MSTLCLSRASSEIRDSVNNPPVSIPSATLGTYMNLALNCLCATWYGLQVESEDSFCSQLLISACSVLPQTDSTEAQNGRGGRTVHHALPPAWSLSSSHLALNQDGQSQRPLWPEGSRKSMCVKSVQFSHSVVSDSLRPHESQHTRPPCPSPTPKVYSNSCPSSR